MTDKKSVVQAKLRAKFKAERDRDAPLARAEYEAKQIATRENTARLKALRLVRESELAAKSVVSETRKRSGRKSIS